MYSTIKSGGKSLTIGSCQKDSVFLQMKPIRPLSNYQELLERDVLVLNICRRRRQLHQFQAYVIRLFVALIFLTIQRLSLGQISSHKTHSQTGTGEPQ